MTCPSPARNDIVRYDEPLAPHTTWRVGGPADVLCVPPTVPALSTFLSAHPTLPLLWLGLGSNTLVRDAGIRGLVVITAGGLAGLGFEGQAIRAEAGVPLAKLARFSVQSGYTGLEFLAGIPGTVGGALAMNAGAAGCEIWEQVAAVETVDRSGERHVRTRVDFEIGYRSVRFFREEWFVSALFELSPGDPPLGMARIREHLGVRNRTQPVQTANAGSVFRNPPGDHAGRLIEQAGLKGLREGGAVVSERHANFIINDAAATASDIERLILRVQAEVHERMDVWLETEVKIVGDAA
ncbi:MAG: UDP-N-acetylmuramate dehydrogenase [Acidiferrobacter sp.]